MPQRIQGVHYSIPDQLQLSHECRDLLSRIFTLDPCQRPSLAAIRQHPWFLQQLPQGLQVGTTAVWCFVWEWGLVVE